MTMPLFAYIYRYFFILLCLLVSVSVNAQFREGEIKSTPLTKHEEEQIVTLEYNFKVLYGRKDLKEASRQLNDIAILYWNHMQLERAIFYYDSSLVLNQKLGNSSGIAKIQNNLGMIYADMGEHQKAHDYFQLTLKERRKNREMLGVMAATINIAVELNTMGRYKEGTVYLKKGLEHAKSLNDVGQIKRCFGMLAETYEKLGDSELSHEYFELYRTFHEQLYKKKENDIKQKQKRTQDSLKIARLNARVIAAEKIVKENELKTAKESIVKYDTKNRQLTNDAAKRELEIERMKHKHEMTIMEAQQRTNFLLAIGSIVFIIAVFLFIGYQQKIKSNRLLADKQKSILKQKEQLEVSRKKLSRKQETLQRQNEKLMDLDSEKNHLIGIVAHDLKSPLNHIEGIVGLMKMDEETLNEEHKEYLSMINTSIGKQKDMIMQILDLNAIESQKMNMNLIRLNMGELLAEVADSFKLTADKKKIHLVQNINRSEGNVLADETSLTQIFQNLISNAIKFSPTDKNIYISLVLSDDDRVKAIVKDEGPGLSESDKKKLFGRFQKLSARPTGGEHSTGLGLSIVKKLAENMNAEIWCESVLGEGASFVIEFDKA